MSAFQNVIFIFASSWFHEARKVEISLTQKIVQGHNLLDSQEILLVKFEERNITIFGGYKVLLESEIFAWQYGSLNYSCSKFNVLYRNLMTKLTDSFNP